MADKDTAKEHGKWRRCDRGRVGRLVSTDDVWVDPKEIEAVQAFKHKRPQTVGEVQQLLCFLSYYRTYVQDFSSIAKPCTIYCNSHLTHRDLTG